MACLASGVHALAHQASLDVQRNETSQAGCHRGRSDVVSGSNDSGPGDSAPLRLTGTGAAKPPLPVRTHSQGRDLGPPIGLFPLEN